MKRWLLTLGLASAMVACTTSGTDSSTKQAAEQAAEQAVEQMTDNLFEVHKDNRIYVFGNFDLYKEFVAMGHTAYMKTYIGDGPKGETLVFGLTSKEKKMASGWKHVDLFKGAREAGTPFYGEMVMEGRLYVFSTYADMVATREVGEAIYRYTDIGAGPKGQTVVYVLNKGNKKQKPLELMAQFKKMYGM